MRRVAVLALFLAACGGHATPAVASAAAGASSQGGPSKAGSASPPSATGGASDARPSGPVALADARRYMLRLINRDRATAGLSPVTLDTGPATRAAQQHASDMAHLAYLGHWGSDGSVPEQRLTAAGGADMVLENAFCVTDEKKRVLDPSPRIDPADVEKAESMFFNEKPPNDGHRQNILKPHHTRVGIGIALARPSGNEILTPCIVQEFVDVLGTYAPLPAAVKVGATIHVAGTLVAGVQVGAVGLTRLPAPRPIPVDELNRRRSYPVPKPYVMYWPKGYETPIPLMVKGQSFSIDVPVSDGGKPGLYEVSVWGKRPGDADFAMVSLRTLHVR